MIRSVGVVVPAHNEQDLLPACLASLRRAARMLPGVPVRLIVVADTCTDRTAQTALQAGVTVVPVSVRNVGAARAAGIREVLDAVQSLDPADVWLATTDADTVVPTCWLRQQVRYAGQGWDAVVGTVQVGDWSAYRPDVRSQYDRFYDGGDGPHLHVHGANLGVRASAYLAAGGFPAVPTAEDHALVTALAARGRVLRTRTLPVITSARRQARAPHGFSHFLGELDSATA